MRSTIKTILLSAAACTFLSIGANAADAPKPATAPAAQAGAHTPDPEMAKSARECVAQAKKDSKGLPDQASINECMQKKGYDSKPKNLPSANAGSHPASTPANGTAAKAAAKPAAPSANQAVKSNPAAASGKTGPAQQ